MKRCTKCGEVKPLEEFYRATGTRDGRRGDCKACNLAAQHRRYVADPETAKARVKKWQQENAGRLNEYRRGRRKDPVVKRADRDGHLRRKYGITVEEYDRMLEEQGGVCAVCGRPPRSDISLHVDHDHETGQVRGLLCFPCNNLLGDAQDDPDRLQRAAAYVNPTLRDTELTRAIAERLEGLKELARASGW